MGNNCCIRGSNNNNNLRKEIQEIEKERDDYKKKYDEKEIEKKEIEEKMNNMMMDKISAGSGSSHSTPGYQKNILIIYKHQKYEMAVKDKYSLSKVLYRFKNKNPGCDYEGICRYNGNQCKLSMTIGDLNIQEGEIIELS